MRGFSDTASMNIYSSTWGHLAPMSNTTYKGKLIIARSQFQSGTVHIIDFEFNGLSSSPWLFETLENKLFDLTANVKNPPFIEGVCYQMNITFRNYQIWLTNIIQLNKELN